MTKEFKINGYKLKYPNVLYWLVQNSIERVENKLDNVILVTGKVGSGKSNLSLGIGILYEHLMGRKLTLDNIHFSMKDVLKELYKQDNHTSTIIHDEAISGSSSRDSTSNYGKFLLRALITKRFKRHLLIMNVDNIKELNIKLIERSVAWIHVSYFRTPNGFIKGIFKIFSPSKAEKVYLDLKNRYVIDIESHPIYYNNKDTFFSWKYFDTIIPEKEYEKKKSKQTSTDKEFIEKEGNNIQLSPRLLSAPLILKFVIEHFNLSRAEICRQLGINVSTLRKLLNDDVINLQKSNFKDKLLIKQGVQTNL